MRKTNILIYGEGGSGKSTAVATVFKLLKKEPDLKVRVLCTEANSIDGIEDGVKRLGITLKEGQLICMICKPKASNSVSSAQVAREYENNYLKKSENDALKVKIETGDRAKRTAFLAILKGMAVFKGIDYVTKEEVDCGDYLKWGADTVFVIDSLTACVDYLVTEVKANRIATVMSDYNHVQTNLMSKVIVPLTEQALCSIIMLGHPVIGDDNTVKQPAKKEDRITKLYPKTFGQALNNTLVSKFHEVIYSYVSYSDDFYWAGKKQGVATSPRKIPRKDKLTQDFSIYGLFGID